MIRFLYREKGYGWLKYATSISEMLIYVTDENGKTWCLSIPEGVELKSLLSPPYTTTEEERRLNEIERTKKEYGIV